MLEGTKLPTDSTLFYLKDGEPTPLTLKEIASEGTWVLVGVPGAFTPPCSEKHIPSYISHLPTFSSKDVRIVVINKDNAFAENEWAKTFNVEAKQENIIFASDPNLKFIKSLKLSTDEVEPLGETSSRFAIVVKDGEIVYVGKEKSAEDVTVSSAETVLEKL
jgi:alkyl hydroperoxide reductase 1